MIPTRSEPGAEGRLLPTYGEVQVIAIGVGLDSAGVIALGFRLSEARPAPLVWPVGSVSVVDTSPIVSALCMGGAAGSASSGVDACRCVAPKPGMQSELHIAWTAWYLALAAKPALKPSLPGGGFAAFWTQHPTPIARGS